MFPCSLKIQCFFVPQSDWQCSPKLFSNVPLNICFEANVFLENNSQRPIVPKINGHVHLFPQTIWNNLIDMFTNKKQHLQSDIKKQT